MARRRGSGRVIDFKAWGLIPLLSADVSTDGTTQGASLVFTSPGTILRVRGYVQAHFDLTVQVGDEMKITFGLGIVSTDAFDAGAVPDLGSEADYPWLWWGEIFLRSELAAGPSAWGISAQRVEVDSKAMRRFKPGQNLAWQAQTTGATGAPVMSITFGRTRVLVGT